MNLDLEKRRDRRFAVRLPVTLIHRQCAGAALVVDAGFRGVLVQTPIGLPLRELLRLRFRIPPGTEPFEIHAMAVRRVDPEGPYAVFGLQFFAVPPEVQRRWDDFIHGLAPVLRVAPAPGEPAAA